VCCSPSPLTDGVSLKKERKENKERKMEEEKKKKKAWLFVVY
jgi:hypothetical protein